MRFAWVYLAVALAGCETGPGGNDLGVCSAVCRCAAPPLPGQQRTCVDECLGEIDLLVVPTACEECVFANSSSCPHLIDTCFGNTGPCRISQPDPTPGGSDAGF
jgi:hypothetical protein